MASPVDMKTDDDQLSSTPAPVTPSWKDQPGIERASADSGPSSETVTSGVGFKPVGQRKPTPLAPVQDAYKPAGDVPLPNNAMPQYKALGDVPLESSDPYKVVGEDVPLNDMGDVEERPSFGQVAGAAVGSLLRAPLMGMTPQQFKDDLFKPVVQFKFPDGSQQLGTRGGNPVFQWNGHFYEGNKDSGQIFPYTAGKPLDGTGDVPLPASDADLSSPLPQMQAPGGGSASDGLASITSGLHRKIPVEVTPQAIQGADQRRDQMAPTYSPAGDIDLPPQQQAYGNPNINNDQPTLRDRVTDFVSSAFGGPTDAQQRRETKERLQSGASADVVLQAQEHGEAPPSHPVEQFVARAGEASTGDLLKSPVRPPDTQIEKLAASLGSLVGFVNPAGVSESGTAAIASKTFDKWLAPLATDELKTAIAKGVANETAKMATMFTIGASGEALDQTSLKDAAETLLQAAKKGTDTGAVFGGASRLVPGSNVIDRAVRIGMIHALNNEVQGKSDFEDDGRTMVQKFFDAALDTVLGWRGTPTAFMRKPAAKPEFDANAPRLTGRPDNTIEGTATRVPEDPTKTDYVVGKDGKLSPAAKEAPGKGVEPEAETTTASVPVVITQAMKEDLRAKGYTDTDIKRMTPKDANDILSATEQTQEGTVKRTQPQPDAGSANTESAPQAASDKVYFDPRLNRQEYRNALDNITKNDFVPGGGSTLVPKSGFRPGESDKPGEVPMVRTPSLNAGWIQSLLSDTGMSVAEVRKAAQKALDGAPLGVRQAKAVGVILDQHQGVRTDPENVAYAKQQLEDARATRRQLNTEAAQPLPEDANEIEHAGEVLLEREYPPEADSMGRVIQEAASAAIADGADPDRVTDIMSRQVSDAQVLRDLTAYREERTNVENRKPESSAAQREPESGHQTSERERGGQAPAVEAHTQAAAPAGGEVERRTQPGDTGVQSIAIGKKEVPGAPENNKTEIDTAAHEAATSPKNNLPEPTEAQKDAGNYRKGHVSINGLDIAIENPAGSRRRPEWPPLAHHYGYIKGTVGKDKDHLDVFLTDHAADTARPVFVVDQVDKAGKFDEHKIVLGATDEQDARNTYNANYQKGWTGLGAMKQLTWPEFKDWLASGKTKEPLALKQERPAREPKNNAAQTDMFGGKNESQQAIADANGAREQKMAGAPSMDKGAGDLFSDKGKQTDIEDVTKTPEHPAVSAINSAVEELKAATAALKEATDKAGGTKLTSEGKGDGTNGKGIQTGDRESDTATRAVGAEGGEQAAPGQRVGSEENGTERHAAEVPARSGELHSGEDIGGARRGSELESERSRDPRQLERNDFTITDASAIGAGGVKTKYKNNIAAIRLLKQLEDADRLATPAEQEVLAKYVGWGGIKNVFDPDSKGWEKEHEELKSLLTEPEYEAARRSMLDAHYTSPQVVTAIWDGMNRLGFGGGRVLEPSVGVGNFFGLMPKATRAQSSMVGVELDRITGAIAKQLYQRADIVAPRGFQEVDLPANSFDAAVGNPPFGNQKLFDTRHPEFKDFTIHNYFFAKTLDKVRPGGVMGMVVSRFFMDAMNSKARELLADKTKLLGAFRLPDTAFKGNANTEVVTDVIFLQKLADGEKADNSWARTGNVPVEDATYPVNQYFIDHPENVLGTFTRQGSMYGDKQLTVTAHAGRKLEDLLAERLATLPEKVYEKPTHTVEPIEPVERGEGVVPPHVKMDAYFVTPDGKLARRVEDSIKTDSDGNVIRQHEVVSGIPVASEARIRGMVRVRDALHDLMRSEMNGDGNFAEKRLKLNLEYDGFVKKHGYINSVGNRRAFELDPDLPRLESLEPGYDRGISPAVAKAKGIPMRAPTARKADVFTKRVMPAPHAVVSHAETPKDSLIASLNEKGKVDLDYMSQISGKEPDTLTKELTGLIYRDPDSELWETADSYLSGNVKAKLAAAKEAADKDDAYQGNVAALEKVQPAFVPASDISVRLGSTWVPQDVITTFARELLGGDPRINFISAIGRWSVKVPGTGTAHTATWGTIRMPAGDILDAIMNMRPVVVRDNIGTRDAPQYVVNDTETQAARAKAEDMQQKFKDWVYHEPARRARLEKIYNDTHVTNRVREYDGSHMTFPGMNPDIKFEKHQKNGVWRIIQERQTLLDHVVGAGKTFEIVCAAMEMRRLGIARKPIINVPNHLTLQWRDEFYRLYPNANILVADKDDFTKANRERLFSRIATGDWDAVVVGHSSFKKVPMPEEQEKEILSEMHNELASAIQQMKTERGDRHVIRDMERIKENLAAKMAKLKESGGGKDRAVSFDELGVDAMFTDEAHMYKNLFYFSQMNGVSGLGNPSGSGRAFDLFVKTRYLQTRFGGKGITVFATGTPISNSLVEMFTMQRYMMYDDLKARGIHLLDSWARTFGDVQQVYEVHPSGTGYRLSNRFAKFVNMPELMTLYRKFADVVTLDDLKQNSLAKGEKYPTPKVAGGKPQLVVAERSPLQARFFGVPEFARAENGKIIFKHDKLTVEPKDGKWEVRSHGRIAGPFDSEEEANAERERLLGEPVAGYNKDSILWKFEHLRELTKQSDGKINALSITNEARKAGLDYRLIDPNAPDFEGSKINLAIENVLRIYKKWHEVDGTQLIFCDLSVPSSARNKVLDQAKKQLERDQAAALDSGKDTEAAEESAEKEQQDTISMDQLLATQSKFSVYDDIKAKLIARGIPANQVAFIHDYDTDIKKAELFKAVNDGRVRVLLGSTEKMGAGTNVQERLVGLHHLDAPWRPSDLEQREGRIIRRGNKLYAIDPDRFEVEIVRYASKQTYDTRMWQIIEHKARGVEQLRKANETARTVDDIAGEAANSADMKAAASGNPLILDEIKLRTEMQSLEAQEKSYQKTIYELQRQESYLLNAPARRESLTEELNKWLALRAQHPPLGDTFAVDIGGKNYTERKEIAGPMTLKLQEALKSPARARIRAGTYRGVAFAFQLAHDGTSMIATISADGGKNYEHLAYYDKKNDFSPSGLLTRIDNHLAELDRDKANLESQFAHEQTELAKVRDELQKPFSRKNLLDETRVKHREVVNKLQAAGGSVELTPEMKQELDQARHERFPWKANTPVLMHAGIAPHEAIAHLKTIPAIADFLDGALSLEKKQREIARGGLRYSLAQLNRNMAITDAALEEGRKLVDKIPVLARWDAMHQYQTGGVMAVKNRDMRALFGAWKSNVDERSARIQSWDEGYLQSVLPHYFSQMWKDPARASEWYQRMMGKGPLEGGKAFLKKRSYASYKEGMSWKVFREDLPTLYFDTEQEARDAARGDDKVRPPLEPLSNNFVDIAQLSLQQMDKFIAMHEFRQELESKGYVKKVKQGDRIPEGYAKVDDPAFRARHAFVYEDKETGESKAGVIQYEHTVPQMIATDINNYLSPGLYKYGWWRNFRYAENLLLSARLGVSAFHAGFTTVDTALSHLDVAGRYLLDLNIPMAAKSLATLPLSPILSPIMGRKYLQQFYGEAASDPNTAAILHFLTEGGARGRMNPTDFNNSISKLVKSWQSGSPSLNPMQYISAGIEATVYPIMHYLVPWQKMAAKVLLAKFALDSVAEKLGKKSGDYAAIVAAMGEDAMRQIAYKVVQQVDDRLGQVAYDNMMWNKIAKDVAQSTIQSVGWDVGTGNVVLGGISDVLRLAIPEKLVAPLDKDGKLKDEHLNRVTGRLSYFIALNVGVALAGAMMQYWLTGEWPQDLRSYYFFKTGRKNPDGTDERMSLPSYVKDEFALLRDPLGTIEHKLHPMFSMLAELIHNKDYYGNEIANPDDPWTKIAEQYGKYALKSVEPYSLRNLSHNAGQGSSFGLNVVAPFIGVTPAPATVSRTPFEAYIADAYSNAYHKTRTPEEAETADKRREAVAAIRRGEKPDLGSFSPEQRLSIRLQAQGHHPIQETEFKRLSMQQKLTAWEKATDEERHKYRLRASILSDYELHHGSLDPDVKAKAREVIGRR